MRLIPGRTKVNVELFKGVSIADLALGLIAGLIVLFVLTSSLPFKLIIAAVLALIFIGLLARIDKEPNYLYLLKILRHYSIKRSYEKIFSDENLLKIEDEGKGKVTLDMIFGEEKKKESSVDYDVANIIAFTDIKDGFIEYAGKYFGMVIEVPPVEFRFFSDMRRALSIENGVGRVLRTLPAEYAANIVKIERPVHYESYLENEYDKIEELKKSYEEGLLSEEEMKGRMEIIFDRIEELQKLCHEDQVIQPYYYIVLFDSDKTQLRNNARSAVDTLRNGEIAAKLITSDKDLALFLKYSNQLDVDETQLDRISPENYAKWAMPQSVKFRARTAVINNIYTHNMSVVNYPTIVGDAWLATVMSMPATKVVIKCTPMDRTKSIRAIDNSLTELRGQYSSTGVDSKRMELEEHIDSLGNLLALLQSDSESLLNVNIYVTSYDINMTRADSAMEQPPKSNLSSIANMKRVVRRTYQEQGFRLNNLEFDQIDGFIGSQISAWDPLNKKGRGIPSNSLAAAYPWVFAHVADANGVKLGSEDGIPVFIDFFRRDSERVNSNMVIVGKSGSGKSYATKSLLANLAADNAKIFILDPENEYTELAKNLNGKFINVGNAQQGRLNPFHIITALDDDEDDGSTVSGSYATHLQFLEEFFRQILPDCEKDALEYLNALVDRMYTNMGITAETNLSLLEPEDYPTFDDLYDAILMEFQSTDNDYIHTMLRTLMNYVSKFSTDGRNANIWNGPSTVTTDENFTVFNFQSLLANRNATIANAQMLLVLKYIDNEIIKNRDYNTKYGLNRKIVVVIDEAHVFIDTKFPIALDFMFQLAKRIRKYNGMQIVITQNIKDFVGSEEIARKSTAIINACQYSFIFALAPNDMDDLCKLYEKAGGINESEREQIIGAARGQAFTIMSPQSRSSFKVQVPEDVRDMFREQNYVSRYFTSESGQAEWEDFIKESKEKRAQNVLDIADDDYEVVIQPKSKVIFEEVSEEELETIQKPKRETRITEDFIDDEIAIEKPVATPIATQPVVVQSAINDESVNSILQAFQQTAAQSAKTEAAMADLINKLGSSAIQAEIKQTVRNEVEREMAAIPAITAVAGSAIGVAASAAMNAAEDTSEDNEDSTAMGSIFNEEAMKEAERLAEEEATSVSEPEEEDEGSGFDIMSILTAEAEKLGNISPIDLMETYGDTIIDITIEDLVAYNNNHRPE